MTLEVELTASLHVQEDTALSLAPCKRVYKRTA